MKVRVYLVEDSSIMSDLLGTLVRANGATVVGRSDAAPTAIEDILLLRPDLVVIDIALRKGNGFDVLKALDDNRTGGKSPVRIVLTNYTLPAYREAARRWGAEYFFDKSNQILEMVRVLRMMSRNSKMANGGSN